MIRAINHFFATGVFITLCLLSGCATSANTVKIDDATALKLRSEVTVYDSKKLSGLEYTTIKEIHATACGNRENGMDLLRSIAHSAGANGVTKVSCGSLLGPTLMQNCLTTTMCEAVAIRVAAKNVEIEKVQAEKIEVKKIEEPVEKQIMSQGEGFTLGKLPLVITSYDAIGGARDVQIIFSGNYMTKGKIVKRDEENNLAIIAFEEFRKVPAGFRIFPSYKVKPGQDIYVIGSTQPGEKPAITKGAISATEGPGGDSRYFGITAQGKLSPGGSPMLDNQGRLIGIVSPGRASSVRAKSPAPQGTYFALKSNVLLNLYPEIEELVISENGPSLSSEQIFEAYSSSVVSLIVK